MCSKQASWWSVVTAIIGTMASTHVALAQTPEELVENYRSGDFDDHLKTLSSGPDFLVADYLTESRNPSIPPNMDEIEVFIRPGSSYFLRLCDRRGSRYRTVLASATQRYGAVSYPRLREGDILPMFGYIYLAVDYRAFIRLNEEDVPEGIEVEEDSLIVPLRRTGQGLTRAYGIRFHLESTEASPENDNSCLVAILCASTMTSEDCETHRLTAGESVTIHGRTFTVVNIVPRDTELGTIGWIELDADTQPAGR